MPAPCSRTPPSLGLIPGMEVPRSPAGPLTAAAPHRPTPRHAAPRRLLQPGLEGRPGRALRPPSGRRASSGRPVHAAPAPGGGAGGRSRPTGGAGACAGARCRCRARRPPPCTGAGGEGAAGRLGGLGGGRAGAGCGRRAGGRLPLPFPSSPAVPSSPRPRRRTGAPASFFFSFFLSSFILLVPLLSFSFAETAQLRLCLCGTAEPGRGAEAGPGPQRAPPVRGAGVPGGWQPAGSPRARCGCGGHRSAGAVPVPSALPAAAEGALGVCGWTKTFPRCWLSWRQPDSRELLKR